MGISVIIPSRNAANFVPCFEAVRQHEPAARIHLVDDGVEFHTVPNFNAAELRIALGAKPFVFARNCNIGIHVAGENDVVLLNDDALLRTPEGFSQLAKLAEEHPVYGLLAPVTNVTGSREQTPQGIGLREVNGIAFVCVYIPRRTIDAVGLLDERFTSYGWEDNDYCHRVRQAGLKIGVFDFCFVDHASLTSTFRGGPHKAGNIEEGRRIFREKWGFAPA